MNGHRSVCVIGSGPAGVACAKALLSRGEAVVMVDAGTSLDPERAQVVRRLADGSSSTWDTDDLALVKGKMAPDRKGIPLKLSWGSDFPYRDTESLVPWKGIGVGVRPSLAMGGLSNVWGAAMLPYREADIADWPIRHVELDEHYRAVARFTGLAAQHDDLEELFPLHCEPSPIRGSAQAQVLLNQMTLHRDALRGAGWRFGRSRLAVRAEESPKGSGCKLCGLCMYGCPYGCIYNSADTVREMRGYEKFRYVTDVVVQAIDEQSGGVVVRGVDRKNGQSFECEARRVFVAGGVIPTAQILLRSLGAFDQPVRLRDSQYFVCPLLLRRGVQNVRTEELHTLSQLFIEMSIPAISRRTVHLQIYTYSEVIGDALRKTFGPLSRPFEWLARRMEERLLVVQGYLHSDESSAIDMTLQRTQESHPGDCLVVRAMPNSGTRQVVKKVLGELLLRRRQIGGIVVPQMLQMAEPGRGFHSGGTFPMRASPERFETDLLGRPYGLKRVHAVDASVLPSVPATTITFAVMANAHRIGWESSELD